MKNYLQYTPAHHGANTSTDHLNVYTLESPSRRTTVHPGLTTVSTQYATVRHVRCAKIGDGLLKIKIANTGNRVLLGRSPQPSSTIFTSGLPRGHLVDTAMSTGMHIPNTVHPSGGTVSPSSTRQSHGTVRYTTEHYDLNAVEHGMNTAATRLIAIESGANTIAARCIPVGHGINTVELWCQHGSPVGDTIEKRPIPVHTGRTEYGITFGINRGSLLL